MKIILNILTHGDERIGIKVAREFNKLSSVRGTLVIQVANQRAYRRKRRFIDQDLNRSFPGKKNGNYEERLAYKLSAAITSADLVIDIHSTKSELRDSLIVTKLDNKTLQYIRAIQPKYVMVMKVTSAQALISQAKVGIAFEYGKDNDPHVAKKIVRDVRKLFSYMGLLNLKFPRSKHKTKYFRVYSEVKKPKAFTLLSHVKNYQLIRSGERYASNGKDFLVAKSPFYPILFGSQNYKTIFGFAGKKFSPRIR